MSGDDRFNRPFDEGDQPPQPPGRDDREHAADDEIPASVTFMEMMRQAAARAARTSPQPPPTVQFSDDSAQQDERPAAAAPPDDAPPAASARPYNDADYTAEHPAEPGDAPPDGGRPTERPNTPRRRTSSLTPSRPLAPLSDDALRGGADAVPRDVPVTPALPAAPPAPDAPDAPPAPPAPSVPSVPSVPSFPLAADEGAPPDVITRTMRRDRPSIVPRPAAPPSSAPSERTRVGRQKTPESSARTVIAAAPAAPLDPDAAHDAAMEAQRIRRVKRRRVRRRRRTVGVVGGVLRTAIVVIAAAGLMATIFTWWTPNTFLSDDVRNELSIANATSAVTAVPTSLPTPNWLRRVGIVSGHRGPENDPGAVCPDGLTEAEINFNVAQLVVRNLRGRGYTVDLLDEFDPRLDNYQAAALVSIHANTCQEWGGEIVSGYLIAAAAARRGMGGSDEILVNCVAQHYETASGLPRFAGAPTVDMTDYHTFREIHQLTPAVIIELGFMNADRATLTDNPDALARGITDGILCFLEPGSAASPTPIVVPTPSV